MDFETETQRDIYRQVKGYLEAIFGIRLQEHLDPPRLVVQTREVDTYVLVLPWGDGDAVICARAYVAYDPDLTRGLLHSLLRENAELCFGGFGVDADGDAFFEYSIVGSTCSQEKVIACTIGVIAAAEAFVRDFRARGPIILERRRILDALGPELDLSTHQQRLRDCQKIHKIQPEQYSLLFQ
jgi:hypothetical protein